MTIFECINQKRSNVHCQCVKCEHNHDGICTEETKIEEYKNSAYVLLEDCDIPSFEYSIYDDMYWY